MSDPAEMPASNVEATLSIAPLCFVMMPFREPFETYYSSIIRPAVVAASLDPKRGDSLFRPSPIVADIWRMIRDAKVLVADLTGTNANVFYELGLAHAIGKPVVLLAETMDDVPFDLRSLRILLYDKDHPSWGAKFGWRRRLKKVDSRQCDAAPSEAAEHDGRPAGADRRSI